MTKVNMKERNFMKKLNFGKGYILQRIMTSGKSLASVGTEYPVFFCMKKTVGWNARRASTYNAVVAIPPEVA